VLEVGDLEVFALTDVVGRLPIPLRQTFPTVPEADWPVYRDLYPDTFWGPEGFQQGRLGPTVIRGRGRTILVDTGIGPGASALARRFGITGELPARLEDAGVPPESIDMVFLTHLHPDHVGSNVRSESPEPFFPNARYVTHEVEWRYWSELAAADPDAAEHVVTSVRPLADLGVLDLVTGGDAVAAGITTLETFGHTPGHTSLVVEADGKRLLVLGDALAHPLQVASPRHHSAMDQDPERASATREMLVPLMTDERTITSAYHFPAPGLGHVADENGRRVWRPLELARA